MHDGNRAGLHGNLPKVQDTHTGPNKSALSGRGRRQPAGDTLQDDRPHKPRKHVGRRAVPHRTHGKVRQQVRHGGAADTDKQGKGHLRRKDESIKQTGVQGNIVLHAVHLRQNRA